MNVTCTRVQPLSFTNITLQLPYKPKCKANTFFLQTLLLGKEGPPYFCVLKNKYEEGEYDKFCENI